jgi:hypothetical protein
MNLKETGRVGMDWIELAQRYPVVGSGEQQRIFGLYKRRGTSGLSVSQDGLTDRVGSIDNASSFGSSANRMSTGTSAVLTFFTPLRQMLV